ncbi:MAG: hypothetical protein JXB85_18100 [Anaerolineales bacterium]|nr:hypothetical protein [Anaerolineales bacterium]
MEFFLDPDIERLPPARTRLLDLRAEPSSDGQRLRLHLELTPFEQRPDLELTLTDPDGSPCGSASIVGPVSWVLELTFHVRKPVEVPGIYTLTAVLSYVEHGEVDRRAITFALSPASP